MTQKSRDTLERGAIATGGIAATLALAWLINVVVVILSQ